MKLVLHIFFLADVHLEDLACCVVSVIALIILMTALIIQMIRNLGPFSLQNQKLQNGFCLLSVMQYSK